MPAAPKPKYVKGRSRKGRKMQMALYGDPAEPTLPAVQPMQVLNLFASDPDSDGPMVYRVEKVKAIEFWAKGYDLPAHAFGRCAVCPTWLHKGQIPAAHHAIIRRSAGTRIDDWQNLIPVCSQHCHDFIENDDVHKEVMIRYYLRLSKYHLMDDEPSAVRGRNYLFHWVRALQAEGRFDERQPYSLPHI